MAKSQELADFEQVVEKIVFDADELEHLKIAIKNFREERAFGDRGSTSKSDGIQP